MEFCDGGTLAERLESGPLSAREAADLVQKVARAMHVAHQRGIVHRDLKPLNILLSGPDRQPKISDFGLARQLDMDSGHTQPGVVKGTPSYMAPEQAAGQTVSARQPTSMRWGPCCMSC